MTNEQKAAEISNNISYEKDRQSVAYRAAIRMAEWKDEQIEQIINMASSYLMITLTLTHVVSLEEVAKLTEQFKINLTKEWKEHLSTKRGQK